MKTLCCPQDYNKIPPKEEFSPYLCPVTRHYLTRTDVNMSFYYILILHRDILSSYMKVQLSLATCMTTI